MKSMGFLIALELVLFLPQCIFSKKPNIDFLSDDKRSRKIDVSPTTQLQQAIGLSRYETLDSMNLSDSIIEKHLASSVDFLLVVKSFEDSLACVPFLPNRESDFVFSFPPRPATYPTVRPVGKSLNEIETEIKLRLMDIQQFSTQTNFVFHPVIVIFDATGFPRGLFMFVEKSQKEIYILYGETILELLKQEKFAPGIDIEVEVSKPVPDILELQFCSNSIIMKQE